MPTQSKSTIAALKPAPRLPDRDVYIVLAVRTRTRSSGRPMFTEDVETGFRMLSRFCDGLGLEVGACFEEDQEWAEQFRAKFGHRPAAMDAYEIYTPAEFAGIKAAVDAVWAKRAAAEEKKAAGYSRRSENLSRRQAGAA